MDFKDLKQIVNENVVDKLDHSNLNDIYPNPTAEIMVSDIAVNIMKKLPKKVFLVSCKLWETNTSYAEFNAVSYGMENPYPSPLQSLLMPAT